MISNGFSYRQTEDGAVIMRYMGLRDEYGLTGPVDALIVPAELDGLPVVRIGPGAFRQARAERIYLPEGIVTISRRAFALCITLEKIHLPESLEEIGPEAFCDCWSLKKVRIPGRVRKIPESAFWECRSLTEVILPDSVEELQERSFCKCEKISRLRIPPGVRLIGSDAFGYGGHKPVCVVTKGSYAEQYCLENGLETEYESRGD